MEGHLPHPQRIIQTYHNVFWPHKFISHLPDDDKYDLLNRSHPRMVISLHGQYCDTHKTRGPQNGPTTHLLPPPIRPPYAKQIRTKQLVSQTGKM